MRTPDPVRTQEGEAVQLRVRRTDEGVRVPIEQMTSKIQVAAETRSGKELEILIAKNSKHSGYGCPGSLLEQRCKKKKGSRKCAKCWNVRVENFWRKPSR